jgi:hypothetical protein
LPYCVHCSACCVAVCCQIQIAHCAMHAAILPAKQSVTLTGLQAVAVLAQGLRGSQEAVLWCKERAARVGGRAAALVPALQELERAVLAPGRGVEVRLVESLSAMLLLLAKV